MPDDSAHRRTRAVRTCLADLPKASTVLVACSGGPDSLALVAATARLMRPWAVAIVDHGLQADSAQVAATAAERCRSLGADDVTVMTVTVAAGPSAGGPEAAARAARRAALTEHAARRNAAAILLGHTREDQAETVLLRLARGSGARSLAAMAPIDGLWRRPFLDLPRQVVRDGVGPAWADPHNDDPRFARTRVRQVALPALVASLGPAVIDGLARSADALREDADALDALAQESMSLWWTDADGVHLAEASSLATLPRAIRTRCLRQALVSVGCPAGALTRAHVVEVDRLASDWHGQGAIALPGGVTAQRSGTHVVVTPAEIDLD